MGEEVGSCCICNAAGLGRIASLQFSVSCAL